MQVGFALVLMVIASMLATVSPVHAESALGPDQLVEIALEVNPQVRVAKANWDAAQHQIRQNYVPADPVFTYGQLDSDRDFDAAEHSHNITQSFQFPGVALLQADNAKRNAEIARLTFEASMRDTRAAVETAYYQVLLDYALIAVNAENIDNLRQVVKVTQTAFSASQHTEADVINAQIALAQAELQQRQYLTNRENDKAALNLLLYRPNDEELNLNHTIHLERLEYPVKNAVDMAVRLRQEILQAALTEKNADTSLRLARMEYLPNYQVGGEYDLLLEPGTRPNPNVHQGWTFTVGFSLPIYFWYHQREDVSAAQYSLEAARYNLKWVKRQTEIAVSQLYRSAQQAYESSQVYAASLIPLARRDFRVSLVAYQSGQVDFLTLSAALQATYNTRAAYLQNANMFLAGVVALEQAIGAPLPK